MALISIKEVIPTGKGVRIKSGDILAGSAKLIPDVIKNYVKATGCELYKAVNSASVIPSIFINMKNRAILHGSQPDIVIFDEEMKPSEIFTWIV